MASYKVFGGKRYELIQTTYNKKEAMRIVKDTRKGPIHMYSGLRVSPTGKVENGKKQYGIYGSQSIEWTKKR